MREGLKPYLFRRGKFVGTFSRFGTKAGWKGKAQVTVLLKDIHTASGVPACDHLWFVVGKRFAAADLKPGDKVRFEARAEIYTKGYQGRRDEEDLPPVEDDLKLVFPTNVEKVGAEVERPKEIAPLDAFFPLEVA